MKQNSQENNNKQEEKQTFCSFFFFFQEGEVVERGERTSRGQKKRLKRRLKYVRVKVNEKRKKRKREKDGMIYSQVEKAKTREEIE